MAQVGITINGQHYTVTCDDGQEERLLDVAAYFDAHVQNIAANVGQIADSRLMLLAGLTVSDELKDLQIKLTQMEDEVEIVSEAKSVHIIENATEKVREISDRLEEVTTTP